MSKLSAEKISAVLVFLGKTSVFRFVQISYFRDSGCNIAHFQVIAKIIAKNFIAYVWQSVLSTFAPFLQDPLNHLTTPHHKMSVAFLP